MFDADCSELILSASADKSRGSTLDMRASRACMIADTLSWAVRHNMPFQQALTSLPFYRKRTPSHARLLVTLKWLFRAPFFIMRFPWLKHGPLSVRIQRVIDDLNRGEKLSLSLHKHMGRMFPDFYLLGIGKAEAESRLDTALPVLAQQMSYPCSVADEQHIQLVLIAYKLLAVGLMLSFLVSSVLPKFHLIFEDLGWASPMTTLSSATGVTGVVSKLLLALAAILLFLPKFNILGQSLLIRVPIAGPGLKRFVIADVAHAMATFIRQGDDIVTAAEWSMKATRSRWMRRRLERFVSLVKAGHRWEDAWCEMKLGRPLDEWVMRNAASRQDPASGFELLAEWLHQEIAQTTQRIEAWLDPCCTVVVAVLVGVIATSVFAMYTQMMHVLM